MHLKLGGIALVALGLVTGCASLHHAHVADHLSKEQRFSVRNSVPFMAQEQYLCGPTVLRMATQAMAPGVPLDTYTELTFTTKAKGTYKSEMLSATRRLGFAPYRVASVDEMLRLVEAGQPVIVFQNLGVSWWPKWHYALLVGYDAGADDVILHSGPSAYDRMSFARFQQTWDLGDRWSYIVTRADDIPLHVAFQEALENASVFEKIGRDDLALRTYQSMNERWPDRYEPAFALSGLYYKQGRKRTALGYTRTALKHAAENPDLLFNLAVLYYETGDKEKAQLIKQRMLSKLSLEQQQKYSSRFGF